MPTKVFISHVASESEVAIWLKKEIGGLLRGAVDFFVSSDGSDIVGGDRWLDKIEAALKESQTVLVLCSEESVHRPWVNFEAGGAWMAGKRVIPLCHDGMEPRRLPQPLATLQSYSLYAPQDVTGLVAQLAAQAGVTPPKFDACRLIQALPPQAITSVRPAGSAETDQSYRDKNTPSILTQPVDQSAYEHDKRTGIYRHKLTREAVCTSCLLQNRVSPLTELPGGWRCEAKDCGKVYSNPDYDPPVPERRDWSPFRF